MLNVYGMTWHVFVEMLRDPMAGPIIAILAVLTTILLFLANRRRKRLSYLLMDTRVLGVHEVVDTNRIQILFDGVPVTEVHLLIITVSNWGNEAIRLEDFERPLRFSWHEPARILTAEITEVRPESLRPTFRFAVTNELVVDPLLLNPGDSFQMKVLMNQSSKLSVDARIVGVQQITKAVSSVKTQSMTLKMLVGMGLTAMLFFAALLVGDSRTASGRVGTRALLIFAFVLALFIVNELKSAVSELISLSKNKDS